MFNLNELPPCKLPGFFAAPGHATVKTQPESSYRNFKEITDEHYFYKMRHVQISTLHLDITSYFDQFCVFWILFFFKCEPCLGFLGLLQSCHNRRHSAGPGFAAVTAIICPEITCSFQSRSQHFLLLTLGEFSFQLPDLEGFYKCADTTAFLLQFGEPRTSTTASVSASHKTQQSH